LGAYVKTVDNESGVYLLSDNVFRYGTHSSVDFLTQKRAIVNVPGPIGAQSLVSGETIIASPNRIDELRAWAREHPGGQIQIQYDCQKPILLGYQIP